MFASHFQSIRVLVLGSAVTLYAVSSMASDSTVEESAEDLREVTEINTVAMDLNDEDVSGEYNSSSAELPEIPVIER